MAATPSSSSGRRSRGDASAKPVKDPGPRLPPPPPEPAWHRFEHGVDEQTRQRLVDWVVGLRAEGQLITNVAGPHRYHRNSAELAEVPPEFGAVLRAMEERFGLVGAQVEPLFGHMVALQEPGAYVHMHRDPAVPGLRHVRMNLMLQVPDEGGMPIIDGVEVPIAPGQAWVFRPYKYVHGTTLIWGARPRVNLSFGWLVPIEFALPGEPSRVGRPDYLATG